MNEQAVIVGTEEGAYRVQASAVTPLGAGSECVTALLELPRGELVAGTDSGRIFCSQGKGEEWRQAEVPAGASRVTSLLFLPTRPAVILAGTADGCVWRSEDAGTSFPHAFSANGSSGPTHLREVPGSAQGFLVSVGGDGNWMSGDGGRSFERSPGELSQRAIHPTDASLWVGTSAEHVHRSTDGGVSYQPVTEAPAPSRPQALLFEAVAPFRLHVLAAPPPLPPGFSEPSPFWVSEDAGASFVALLSGFVDSQRDPSGEITAFDLSSATQTLYYGTNRGELLALPLRKKQCEMLAGDLPPIRAVLVSRAGRSIDPSTSGICVLP